MAQHDQQGEFPIREEFRRHDLNYNGKVSARVIEETFTATLDQLEEICGKDGREMDMLRTKLQEASFYAKRALAVSPTNQEVPTSEQAFPV